MDRGCAPLTFCTLFLFSTIILSCTDNSESFIEVCAAGDIFLGRGVEKSLKVNGHDFSWPFEEAAPILKRADVAFGNLEGPVGPRGEADNFEDLSARNMTNSSADSDAGRVYLVNPQESFTGLVSAGFDILNVANNHSFDRGRLGLAETLQELTKRAIRYTGVTTELRAAGNAEIFSVKNIRIGFLGFSWLPPELEAEGVSGIERSVPDHMRGQIRNLKRQVDFVIVSLHWGRENSFFVSSTQRKIARYLIDSGADTIIGHHPHRIQAVERYKGKPIAYSLGNFLFDQQEAPNREGLILRLNLSNQGIRTELIPYRIEKGSRIHLLSGKEAEKLFSWMQELCSNVDTRTHRKGDRLVVP